MNMTTVPSNQLKAMQHEIESLKEQVAAWKLTAEQHKENFDILNGDLRMKLTQQAAVIEQMRDVLEFCSGTSYIDDAHRIADEALAIQPSPEILQARDERVAEACAKAYEQAFYMDKAEAIRSGEWRKYL